MFIDDFRQHGDITFKGMRDTACDLLRSRSRSEMDKLYDDLQRGKCILDDEDHLNAYLRSFGNMHQAKLKYAFDTFPKLDNILVKGIEIFDWGCGQGIATLCLLDYIVQNRKRNSIIKVNLIEPSNAALQRTVDILNCYKQRYNFNFIINTVCKKFDDLADEDVYSNTQIRIHLFSNILDVDFDLIRFIRLFQRTCLGYNYFICVGPYYSNSRRVDDFIAAICPNAMYSSRDFSKRQFVEGQDWTLSMRLFLKISNVVEDAADIRRRIQESHCHEQYFAGYILDSVSQVFKKSDKHERAELLLKALSTFDVRSDKPLDFPDNIDSKIAVLSNIISRGLPTLAPVEMENLFSDIFHISTKPFEDSPSLSFDSNGNLKEEELFEALHIIDPRFNTDNYNGDMLESDFEKSFINTLSQNQRTAYLTQILEPQRPLSTIVSIPNQQFAKERRVDFSLQLPYSGVKDGKENGFIVEIDGSPYHSNIFNRINDLRRDNIARASNWTTTRINDLDHMAFIHEWENNVASSDYLKIVNNNYH